MENSPKTSSTKLWAGLLGILCTHCVIQAQTYIKVPNFFILFVNFNFFNHFFFSRENTSDCKLLFFKSEILKPMHNCLEWFLEIKAQN